MDFLTPSRPARRALDRARPSQCETGRNSFGRIFVGNGFVGKPNGQADGGSGQARIPSAQSSAPDAASGRGCFHSESDRAGRVGFRMAACQPGIPARGARSPLARFRADSPVRVSACAACRCGTPRLSKTGASFFELAAATGCLPSPLMRPSSTCEPAYGLEHGSIPESALGPDPY